MTTSSLTAAVLALFLAVGDVPQAAGAFSSSFSAASSHRATAAFGLLSSRRATRLASMSDEGGEEEPKLVYGAEAEEEMESESFQSKLGALGDEAGYLAAAKKRAEEARAKMLAEAEDEARRAEQEEAYLKEQGEWRRSENYGPGDLSGAAGEVLIASDDGWEKSLGTGGGSGDEQHIISSPSAAQQEGGEGEGGEEEPTLFIPSGDDGDGPIVF